MQEGGGTNVYLFQRFYTDASDCFTRPGTSTFIEKYA
jgi:hypothetical protein